MPEQTIKDAPRKGRFAKHTDDIDADADAACMLDFGKLRRRAHLLRPRERVSTSMPGNLVTEIMPHNRVVF
jgi:hypothetical protein